MIKKTKKHSRRAVLTTMASVVIVPRHVLGGPNQTPPSERVRVASIGVGGMGGGDVGTISRLGAEMVALCDVDASRAAGSFNAFPKAKKYQDFRVMLEKESKNIDAITVSTPDHTHAVASLAALRMGKHIYCQKPLTQTLFECRAVTQETAKAGVITSMGNQGHASEGSRLTNEWIQGGLIGEVREVFAWSDRAGKLWKQGIGKPKETPAVPATLNWDLWLGPRKERPYHPAYAPHNWRGWWDFGTGALGDMGCHIIDHPVWALDLGAPTTVEARTTLDGSVIDGKPNFDTFPIASAIYYEFPGRGKLPPVRLTWFDGGLMPPSPKLLPINQKLPDNGVLYLGSKGIMFHSSHGGMPKVFPAGLQEEAKNIAKTFERSPGHYEEWVLGCKTGKKPAAGFHYTGPMTETVLLGVLALRFPGTRLEWDGPGLRVKNLPQASEFIQPVARKGWEI